ncbi:MAG: MFS transporter [Gammaproteobacteria bacterium]|nr:MFS transporter [Gammaproteobacteria bacterium]
MTVNQKEISARGITPVESRAAISLASIFSLRMLGLFLILPVFALYAEELVGVTPMLVGLAIGAYGLTQALLQIPFGMLSDRIGRKPVIIGGLLIFAFGSVVAAQADTIWGVILGRALQGSGAIAAAVMALAADLTQEHNRLKVMAVIGMSIGASFALALVLGPIINVWIGVRGIFWLTAVLALAGVGIALFMVPDPKQSVFHRDTEAVPGQFARVLANRDLLRLNLGILVLHMCLTAVFLVLPLALRDTAGLDSASHWKLYFPVLMLSVLLMIPFVVVAESRRKLKQVFLLCIALMATAQIAFYVFFQSLWGVAFALLLYFTVFNVLEATLPSLVAKMAPVESKGTAMGVYSTSQFGGAFLGGVLGGWIHTHFSLQAVFLFAALAIGVWLLVASGMSEPRYLNSYLLRIGAVDAAQARELELRLLALEGVGEAVVVVDDETAYLKIDPTTIDMTALDEFFVARG